ncbi:MAG: DNA polymerase III subunit beta [Coriobacteriales bacterium]
MRFNIAKDELIEVLNIVSKGMSSRSTLPILSGILVSAQDSSVTFQTTDLEISIRHSVVADVEEPGSTVVPGKLFTDISKALPDAAVRVATDADQVVISCMDSAFTLSTLNPVDFPAFPQVETSTKVVLPSKRLSEAVRKVGKAVSRDESRAILTGILFAVEDDTVRLAATDSYRLAVADLLIEEGDPYEPFQAIIPGRIFEDVSKMANGYDTIAIAFSENQVVFSFGACTFVSRKIEGTYPNYKQLLPKDSACIIKMPVQELVSTVKRVSILAQAHTPVRFSFNADEQRVTISAKTQDVGASRAELEAEVEGESMDIAFNHQYLLDGLQAVEGDVLIKLQSSLKPGVLHAVDDDSFLYLAMPVRLA